MYLYQAENLFTWIVCVLLKKFWMMVNSLMRVLRRMVWLLLV